MRGMGTVLQVALVWGAALLYTTSWAAFWNTGIFLDQEGLAFWLPHPVQVMHWVYPPLAVGVLAAATAITALLTLGPPRLSGLPGAGPRRFDRAVAGVLATCVAFGIGGRVIFGWDVLGRSPSPYAVKRGAHAGPIVHVLSDMRRRQSVETAAAGTARSTDGDVRVVSRPLISLERYLAGAPAGVRPWNVVMIQIESLRSDQLEAYGGAREVMPAIEALAREARVFTNAYVQASHSNYADLVALSSHYPLRSRESHIYPENPTYPRVLIYDILKGLGYKTALISSQNERWGGMLNFHRPSSLDRLFHAETFDGPTYTPWEDRGFAEWVSRTEGAGSVDDRYTVDEAIKWIDDVRGSRFFLHMNLQSSHVPYVVPHGFKRPFGPQTLDFTIMWDKFPQDKIDVVKDRYADSLFYADTQVARLFAHLRSRGLWDNTLFVIGGDNGEAFYEHGFAAHASWLFDEVMKVPMIIKAPGLAAGVDGRPAMFLDAPPTILDLLGLPPHPAFQGISLVAPSFDPMRSMYMIVQTPAAYESAIVRGRYKLHHAEFEDSYVLNDLGADPGETMDVGRSRPEVMADLAARLRRWRQEQLAYYADVSRHSREYPPVIEE